MPITDSRQGVGVLRLGTVDFAAQISNVRLVPSHNSEDGTKTLGIPNPAPLVSTSYALQGSAIQDWEDTAGFLNYTWQNNNTEVPFTWTPNNAKHVTYTGTCQVLAIEVGGEIDAQTTSDFEFAVVGTPTRSETAPTGTK